MISVNTPQPARSTMPNRRTTLPPRLSELSKSSLSPREAKVEDEGKVETLFATQAAKVVSFTVSSRPQPPSRSPSLSSAHPQTPENEPVGTLPWRTGTERVVASGYLRVYQAPGSVNFIHSREMLKPILPKTQCWCVDGESKFVLLRMSISNNNTYWRIELPNQTDEEKGSVQEFIRVLEKILQYEKTSCPFKREHTVELPENTTPVKLRPWKPKSRHSSFDEAAIPSSANFGRQAAARRGSYFSDRNGRLNSPKETPIEEELGSNSSGSSSVNSLLIDQPTEFLSGRSDSSSTKRIVATPQEFVTNPSVNFPDPFTTPTKPSIITTESRIASAPPKLVSSFVDSQDEPPTTAELLPQNVDTASVASSIESFHSFQSFHDPSSPLDSSPCSSSSPSPTTGLDVNVSRTRQHQRDASELTIKEDNHPTTSGLDTADFPEWLADDTMTPTCPKTPPLTSDSGSDKDETWSDAVTPSPPTTLRRRINSSRQRVHSPLLSPANLYSPQSRLSGHHLTTALLQKTCSLLLGPPVQLVALMLNIAARIRNGTFGVEGYGDGTGSRIPGTWEYSDEEGSSRGLWDEDDFGVSLTNDTPKRPRSASPQGLYGSWEID